MKGRNDIGGIERFLRHIDARLDQNDDPLSKAEIIHLAELRGAVKQSLNDMVKKAKLDSPKDTRPVGGITLGLDEPLRQANDLDRFTCRVKVLFQWHATTTANTLWVAPYFAMIQSSGMGKTKLFRELRKVKRNAEDFTAKTVLCKGEPGAQLTEEEKFYFDYALSVPLGTSVDDREFILKELNRFLETSHSPFVDQSDSDGSKDDEPVGDTPNTCKNIVLLLDETQHLVKRSDGWHFRVVRWWLRQRAHVNGRQPAAVFAGTTSQLANFFHEPPGSTTSRDFARSYHDKGTKLLDPFYEILTIGAFSPNENYVKPLNQLSYQNMIWRFLLAGPSLRCCKRKAR